MFEICFLSSLLIGFYRAVFKTKSPAGSTVGLSRIPGTPQPTHLQHWMMTAKRRLTAPRYAIIAHLCSSPLQSYIIILSQCSVPFGLAVILTGAVQHLTVQPV
jgi:hypothetical protein